MTNDEFLSIMKLSANPANRALAVAFEYGQIDGAQHKAWVIDQMVRVLCPTDQAYNLFVAIYEEDREWGTGIAP